MSEKDLGLKLATRRLFWSMGMSTRLNVKLSTHVSGTRSKTEEFTDLDVLGISLAADGRASAVIGDCKTVKKAANERCFWLRGVSDFFDAKSAYLVRSFDVPVSTRQLAERLGLGVLTEKDLRAMQGWYERPVQDSITILFDADAIKRQQDQVSQLDTKLGRLVDYRNLGYWIVEPHRTIDGVIHNLGVASEHLDANHPSHQSLFFDVVWLFSLSLIHATAHVRDTFASDVELALKQYVFGGPAGLREKQIQADLLKQLTDGQGERGADVFEVLPAYFPGLMEVTSRHLRRPTLMTEILRYAEWLTLAALDCSLRSITLNDAFGDEFNPVAAKLLGDTVRFLAAASKLDDAFGALDVLTAAGSSKTPSGNGSDRPNAPDQLSLAPTTDPS